MVATIIDVQQSQEHDLINSFVASQHNAGNDDISVDIEEPAESIKHNQNKIQDCSVCLKIEIKDEGIGISEENMKRLFIDFSKLD